MMPPDGEDTPEARPMTPGRSPLTRGEAAEFSRQVASLARSGLALPSGLRALAEEVPSPRLRRVLNEVAGDLQAGESLGEVLRSRGEQFPASLRGLIAAGAKSGRLAEALSRFLDVNDMGNSLRGQMRRSLIYPTMLILLGSGLFVFAAVTTANSFESIFLDFGIEIPWITQQLLAASRVAVRIGGWMLAGPFLALAVLWVGGRFLLDARERSRIVQSLPLIGPLARYTAIAEFCPVLALLLEGEVPLPEALNLAAETAKDPTMAATARDMAEEVGSGASLGDAMKGRRPFPVGFHALVGWAESHRGLAEALRMSAATFEARARAQAAFVGRSCNILAMVVVLWWVGLTVLALLLPMLQLISALSGSGPITTPWVGYAILKVAGLIIASLVGLVVLIAGIIWTSRRFGSLFMLGLTLCGLSILGILGSSGILSVLADYVPDWWNEAVSPHVRIFFSAMAGMGILLMFYAAFATFSASRDSTPHRVRIARVIGPQMSLRHMMFAIVPLALVFVVAKDFGWQALTVPAMLAPPILAVSLVVAIANRRTLQRDGLLGVLAMAAREDQPLGPAVVAFAEGCRGWRRTQLLKLAQALRDGSPLPEAIRLAPGAFSKEGEVIVSVGHETNTLARSLDDAIAAISARRLAQIATAGMIGYPFAVLAVIVGVTTFMIFFYTPQVNVIFRDYGLKPPEPARTILEWMRPIAEMQAWQVVLAGLLTLVATAVLGFGLVKSGLIASIRDRILRRRHTSIVLRALAGAVDSGRTLLSVVDRMGRTYPRRWVRRKLARVGDRIGAGEPLWASLRGEGLIRRDDAAVLESASGAGNLAWALREMADSGERRLTYRIQSVGLILQPLVVLALGATVLLVALTYFRPLVIIIQSLSGPDL